MFIVQLAHFKGDKVFQFGGVYYFNTSSHLVLLFLNKKKEI